MMIQLLYVSRSNLADDPAVIELEMSRILSSAYINNSRVGVTGILLQGGDYFAQLLEGPEPGVRAILNLIERDTRHRELNVLYEKRIDQPSMPGAAMGCAGMGTKCPTEIAEAIEIADSAAGAVIGQFLLDRARAGDLDLPQQAVEDSLPFAPVLKRRHRQSLWAAPRPFLD